MMAPPVKTGDGPVPEVHGDPVSIKRESTASSSATSAENIQHGGMNTSACNVVA